MNSYIETLGRIIEKQVVDSPDRARALLMAAYSWVRFSGKLRRRTNVRQIADRMNSGVAGTLVDSFRNPENAVMVNIFMPCELIHAMELVPLFPEGLSCYIANTACERVFVENSEACDVSDTFCSYHKLMIGVAETGVMPAPRLIVNTTLACDANQLSFPRLARYYQVPHFVIDVPNSADEESVAYVARQLKDFTGQLETIVGRKLDPEKLRETMLRSRKTIECLQKHLDLRSQVSLDTTMTSELCSLIATHIMLGRPEALRFMSDLLKVTQEKAHQPEPLEHKPRIYWVHTLPNWQDSLRELLDASPRCELVGSDITTDMSDLPDPDHPFESMARRLVNSSMNGLGKNRIERIVKEAKRAGADGVVVFCHWGCKQTLGLSQLAKRVLEDAGLPTLVLDGDGCDSRNVADGQMVTRLNAFFEQLGA